MERNYKNPDTPALTSGNVVIAVRDYSAEQLPEHQRHPRAVTDYELCNYVEGLYLGWVTSEDFKRRGGQKVEVRCENKNEAEYLRALINKRCADPTGRFEVTYYS